MATGCGMLWYYKYTRDQRVQEVLRASDTSAGKAQVGGPFTLTDQDGKPFSDTQLRGEFAILYFGFTFCPDICPDELDKLQEALDIIDANTEAVIKPVFITVDPERDTVSQMKGYIADFHPRLTGLTGSMEEIQRVCKAFRVYHVKADEDGSGDYLVDHSIIMYLINPDGEFLTYYGKNFTAQAMADSIRKHVAAWADSHPAYKEAARSRPKAKQAEPAEAT